MSRKLGEILVESGRLTEAQLHRALTAQLVFGGHLGTTLLELDYIDEATLAQTLSVIYQVPCVDFEALSKVPYAVIRSLPAKLVEKHKVVPLGLTGKRLQLAMINPKDLPALDEISFVTGYHIEPMVSPEVHVLQALDFYYNIRRSQRFITLAGELGRSRASRTTARSHDGTTTQPNVLAGPASHGRQLAAVAAVGGSATHVTPPMPGSTTDASDHWEKYGYGRSWRELADELDPEPANDSSRSEEVDTRPQLRARLAGPVAAPQAALVTPPTLLEAARRMAGAASVDEVISAVLAYSAGRLPRAIFFVMRGGKAQGLAGQGDGVVQERVKALSLAAGPASVLSLVPRGASHYLGPAPAGAAASELYRPLGLMTPRSVMLVPVIVKDRVTGYLYGDSGERGGLAVDVPSLLSVCGRAGMALQIIILRNKILGLEQQ